MPEGITRIYGNLTDPDRDLETRIRPWPAIT